MDITLMAHPVSVQLMSESVYPKYSIDSGTKCHLDVFGITPASLEWLPISSGGLSQLDDFLASVLKGNAYFNMYVSSWKGSQHLYSRAIASNNGTKFSVLESLLWVSTVMHVFPGLLFQLCLLVSR